MSLDTNALLKAAGIGAAALLVLSLLAQIPLLGVVCCCIAYLAFIAVGAGYGFFARKNGGMLTVGGSALGGAIAGAIAGVVQGLIGGLAALIFAAPATMAQTLDQLRSMGYDVPPEVAQLYSTAGVGVIGIFASICWGFFIAAILGAIGGAIYAVATQNQPPTMASV